MMDGLCCICAAECIEVRNNIYTHEAPRLSMQSCEAAIADWGGDKLKITHVVAVTCTGSGHRTIICHVDMPGLRVLIIIISPFCSHARVFCPSSVIVPGLEFQVMSGLGLHTNTQRLSIQFMGCFGALSGMKAARALAMENKNNRALNHRGVQVRKSSVNMLLYIYTPYIIDNMSTILNKTIRRHGFYSCAYTIERNSIIASM